MEDLYNIQIEEDIMLLYFELLEELNILEIVHDGPGSTIQDEIE